ncbi:MAG: hypothetical protein HC877_09495 [Thioploca sp.]|nr:hypothetical protein [Thioploca sp.]
MRNPHYTLVRFNFFWQWLIMVLVMTISSTLVAQDALKLNQLVQALESTEPMQRLQARIDLKNYLENSDDNQRAELLQTLITALPSHNQLIKNGICSTLDALKLFWIATRQDEVEQVLYTLYQQETDEALKALLDRALMRAKGLYRDAMEDFNNDKVDPSVEAKFRRVYETYPKSTYAPKAHFFLGQYYLRSLAILKERNQPTQPEEYLNKANQVFQDLLDKSKTVYEPPLEHLLDAHYFRALNFVQLNQVNDALKELKDIQTQPPADEKIYIYQFFYSNLLADQPSHSLLLKTDIIDKFLDSTELARYTQQYLETNQNKNFKEVANLRDFSAYLQKRYKEK